MFSCRISINIPKSYIQKSIQARSAVFGRRMCSGTSCRGSLTLEAALSLPVIIFAMVLLMTPFKIISASGKMQAAAETVCADVSRYAYTKMQIKSGKPLTDDSGLMGDMIDAAASVALGEYTAGKAKQEVADANLVYVTGLNTECMIENDTITIVLDYKYRLPFLSLFGIDGMSQSVVSSRRAWTGKNGSGVSGGSDESGESDDEWVWIGANPTRYHLTPDCHYLSNNFQTGTVTGNSKTQTINGKKYTACARCAGSCKSGMTVYVLPAGSHFHTSQDCSALAAYVKKVKKNTVEHLGPCSYCGK